MDAQVSADDFMYLTAATVRGIAICAMAGIEPTPENVVAALQPSYSRPTEATHDLMRLVAQDVRSMKAIAETMRARPATN